MTPISQVPKRAYWGEGEARKVLLVRSFEERDPEGTLISPEERVNASEAARERCGNDEARLISFRAGRLFEELRERVTGLSLIESGDLLRSRLHLALLVLLALLLGFLANPLAGEKTISALNFPLLGLVAWNLLVYAGILLYPLCVGLAPVQPRNPDTRVRTTVRWLGERLIRVVTALQGEHRQVAGGSFRRFWSLWLRTSAPLMQLRSARHLHILAATLVIGNLAGMYYRGLIVEYQVAWESTFLTAEQVNALLGFIFAPAAAVLQQPTPQVGEAADAAVWFHFSAVTGLLFVLLPRALLTAWSALRIRRLSRALPVELGAPYFRRLLSAGRGEDRTAVVAAHGHDLPPEHADRVEELLHTLFGARGDVCFADSLAYGDQASALLETEQWSDFDGRHRCAVLVFRLDQTAEREVQGELIRALRAGIGNDELLVLVDRSGWPREEQEGAEAARRAGWTDELVRAGAQPVHLDLSRPLPDDVLEACDDALEALWSDAPPAPAAEEDDLEAELAAWDTYEEVLDRPQRSPNRIQISLISHTNLGKTTLARTLLKRDVGRVLDQAHVTDRASAWTLLEDDGAQLVLWDTPGFGDTVRLLERFRRRNNALGWVLNQVWDRVNNRALWFNQRTLRHIHEQSDVVIYLVKASDDPGQVGYLDPELELIAHFELPVLMLLNHVRTTADTEAIEDAWRTHVERYPQVRSVLTLDAFDRCWVEEIKLFQHVRSVLADRQATVMDRLMDSWRRQNAAAFERSVEVIVHFLVAVCIDYEPLEYSDSGSRLENLLGKVTDTVRQKKAKEGLSRRLEERHLPFIRQLIETQGLSVDQKSLQNVKERLSADFSVPRNTAEEARWITVISSVVSGAATGLTADFLAGGLTFGGGLLAGSLGGLLAGLALGKAHILIHAQGAPAVCWSPTFLTAFSRYALLTYITAAHFGRGRGQFKELGEGCTETHQPWIEAVELALEAQAARFSAQWEALAGLREELEEAGDDESRAAIRVRLEQALTPIFSEGLRMVLIRLYPGAEALMREEIGSVTG